MSAVPVYDSRRRPPPYLEEALEVWRYRDLVAILVQRDIKLRYKRSVLGVGWTLLNPLATMVILTLVFSQLFRFDLPAYPVYLLAGTLLWNFIAQSTTAAMHNLRAGAPLISKIYLPRTAFALAAVLTNLVNLAIATLPLLAIAVAFGLPLTPALLWLPFAALVAALFALGLGLLLSAFAISFPDVIDMYQIVLSAWYFLTPVLYPASIVPPAYRWVLDANPAAHLVEAFRSPVYRAAPTSLESLLAVTLVSLVVLALGWTVFSARADQVAYRL